MVLWDHSEVWRGRYDTPNVLNLAFEDLDSGKSISTSGSSKICNVDSADCSSLEHQSCIGRWGVLYVPGAYPCRIGTQGSFLEMKLGPIHQYIAVCRFKAMVQTADYAAA